MSSPVWSWPKSRNRETRLHTIPLVLHSLHHTSNSPKCTQARDTTTSSAHPFPFQFPCPSKPALSMTKSLGFPKRRGYSPFVLRSRIILLVVRRPVISPEKNRQRKRERGQNTRFNDLVLDCMRWDASLFVCSCLWIRFERSVVLIRIKPFAKRARKTFSRLSSFCFPHTSLNPNPKRMVCQQVSVFVIPC